MTACRSACEPEGPRLPAQGYTPFEIGRALESLTVLVDTREQDTPALRRRLAALGHPWRREKLDFGDYSAELALPDGRRQSLAGRVAVERKMSLDELCQCFTGGRARFEREFRRAEQAGARIYLLVEGGSWEKLLAGEYRSRMRPDALAASLLAWSARYGLTPLFCRPETTGRVIGKILKYEAKAILERGAL